MSGSERLRTVALGTTTMAALAGAGVSAYLWARAFTGGAELVVRPPSVDAVRQEVVPALIDVAEPRRQAHRAVNAQQAVGPRGAGTPDTSVSAPRAIPISRPSGSKPAPAPTPPASNPGTPVAFAFTRAGTVAGPRASTRAARRADARRNAGRASAVPSGAANPGGRADRPADLAAVSTARTGRRRQEGQAAARARTGDARAARDPAAPAGAEAHAGATPAVPAVPPSHAGNDENCNPQGQNEDHDRGKRDDDEREKSGRKP